MVTKVKKYEHILINWLSVYAKDWTDEEMEYQLIGDKERRQYLVVRVGWDKQNVFRHVVVFHFQIKEATGKIWIYVNNTDREIGQEFAALGIPPSDFVIAFVPKEWRAQSGYAVA